MGDQELAELLKLDITLLANDRSREVVLKPPTSQYMKQERQVIIWTRKCDLTERVYVEESPQGELRVVKRVAWRDKTVANCRSELIVLGRLSKAGRYVCFPDQGFPGRSYNNHISISATVYKQSTSSTS